MTTQPQIQMIPLEQLVPSQQHNARRTGGDDVTELVASIRADGLLQNLTVIPGAGGTFEVVAGSRRLRALQRLANAGELASNEVPCRVVDAAAAMDASTAENTIREQMHPADEVEAYARLRDGGRTVEDIAVRFGQSRRHVARMLRLAALSPAIMAEWRQDALDVDQAQGLALTEDHALQEDVWNKVRGRRWGGDGERIRELITEGEVPVSSALGKFVGVEAYEAAGGQVRRDLFADADQAYLIDRELVERLAMEKLEASAARQRKKGWLWVEPALEFSYSAASRMDRLYDKPTDEERAIAGVFVTIGRSGRMEVEGPYIRPADRRAAERGEDPAAPGAGKAAPPKDELSTTQVQRLYGWRTAMLRATVAGNPDLMIRALTAALASKHFDLDTGHAGTLVHVSVGEGEYRYMPRPASEGLTEAIAQGVDADAADAAWLEAFQEGLDEGEDLDLLAWLINRPMEATLQLLAHVGTKALLAVDMDPDGELEFMQLAGVNPRDHWQPTAEWLATLTKPMVLRIVREVLGADQAEALQDMKKRDLAIKATELLIPTDYVPAPLRPAGFDAPWRNAP